MFKWPCVFRVRGKCENRKTLWNEIIACGQRGKNVGNVVIHLAGGQGRDYFFNQYFMYTEWGENKWRVEVETCLHHLSLEWLWTRHRVTLSLWFSICRMWTFISPWFNVLEKQWQHVTPVETPHTEAWESVPHLNSQVEVTQSWLTLCYPMVYTVYGILQARIQEWVALPFSRASSQPMDWAQVSLIAAWFFTSWATREAQVHTQNISEAKGPPSTRVNGSWHCVLLNFSSLPRAHSCPWHHLPPAE